MGKADLEMTSFLVEQGLSLLQKEKKGINEKLLAESQAGNVNAVKITLAVGANTEEPLEDGSTPLSLAAGLGHLEIVKLLVDAGAKVDIRVGMYSVSPLYMASVRSHLAVAKFLMENGANKDGSDAEGQKEFDKISKKK